MCIHMHSLGSQLNSIFLQIPGWIQRNDLRTSTNSRVFYAKSTILTAVFQEIYATKLLCCCNKTRLSYLHCLLLCRIHQVPNTLNMKNKQRLPKETSHDFLKSYSRCLFSLLNFQTKLYSRCLKIWKKFESRKGQIG